MLRRAEDLDDRHHVGTIALLKTGALATLDLTLYEVTTVAEFSGAIRRLDRG